VDYNDVDAYWYRIKSVINKGVSMFVPKRDKYAWKKKKSWRHSVTQEAPGLIHRKHRLWNRLLETKDPSVSREYKRVRNLVRKQSRQRDRKEQQEVARQSRVNLRRFWSYVRGKTTNRRQQK